MTGFEISSKQPILAMRFGFAFSTVAQCGVMSGVVESGTVQFSIEEKSSCLNRRGLFLFPTV